MFRIGIPACLIVLTVVACAPAEIDSIAPGIDNLDNLASEVFGIDPDSIEQRGEERNIVGVRSAFVAVSQRTDSRTFFVEDMRYQGANELGNFAGSDEELVEICRKFIDRLSVPPNEIAQASVLTEKLQSAQLDTSTGQYRPGSISTGKRFVEMTRTIEGIPVFSSKALIGITKGTTVGSLEAHWPKIPKEIVAEAQELQELVRASWKPPVREGTIVESIEAGVIHSPAIGFVMDIYPVIRVILASEEADIGKKAVLYLDRNGLEVPVPRTFSEHDEQSTGKRKSKSQ